MTDQDLRSQRNQAQRGVALISVLLLLVLISALVVAVLYKVNTEQRLQKTDSQNNQAYYGAEAGMEKVMADLDALYAQKAAPLCADITNLQTLQPAGLGVTYANYRIDIPETSPANICTTPPQRIQNISSGMTSGMKAYIVPLTVTVTADRPGGEQASMIRQVEVALIPIFQFGVFSDSDLSFFPGPEFDFNGRVHTNGNLFLASEDSVGLTFHTFIRAAKDVVRDQLANGAGTVAQGRTEPVNIPTAPNGCPSSNCRNLRVSPNEGSSIGGPSTTYGGTGTANSSWDSLSKSTYNSMIMSGSTGAKPLHLEFVQAGVDPIEIIRRAPLAELATSNNGQSRRYHLAQIRVLLSDDPEELPGGAGDANNIRLANVQTNGTTPNYSNGVPVPAGFRTYFAEASTDVQDTLDWGGVATQTCLRPDWDIVPVTPAAGTATYTLKNYKSGTNPDLPAFTVPTTGYAPFISSNNTATSPPACIATAAQIGALLPTPPNPVPAAPPAPPTTWNLIDGYLRVEIRLADGSYTPVTKEWLELGFARGFNPPKTGALNTIHPNAILIFQQLADRNGNNNPDAQAAGVSSTIPQDITGWSPTGNPPLEPPNSNACQIHGNPPRQMYLAGGTWRNCRSGTTTIDIPIKGIERPAEVPNDPATGSPFKGAAAGANSITRNNWYPINFYDAREGEMRDNSDATDCKVGGIINVVEIDVKNLKTWLSANGSTGRTVDQESQNGYVLYFSDRRGMLPNPNAANVKNGEYGFEDVINPGSGSVGTPDGVRDAGEDVDANGQLDVWGKDNLGLGLGAAPNPFASVSCMTTARRNWISGARHGVRLVNGSLGNLPKRWDTGGGGFTLVSENPAYVLGDYNATGGFAGDHASAAVIADTVTLLSNDWTDLESFTSPTDPGGRDASTTYFRLAIASGKNMNFPMPAWGGTPTVPNDYGTDGGVHNFLRYLESWGGDTSYYMGSMVSLYYSQYATGVYKCCNTVYTPPTRNYVFDLDFNDLSKMPPGTPRLRDVVDVGFQQVF